MSRSLCFFLGVLLSGFLFGQANEVQISGKVITNKRHNVLKAELFLKVKDSVYKALTNEDGEYRFIVKRSKAVAELYIHSGFYTLGGASKRSCFLTNNTKYKIDLLGKPEPAYDFELKLAGIDYSTPSILFKNGSHNVVAGVTYGIIPSNIDEVINYFYSIAKDYPKMVLELTGTVSSNEKSSGLALKRAKYVAGLLVKKGVAAANLKCVARGTELPEVQESIIISTADKAEAEKLHAMNRRVIIKVVTLGEGVVGDRENVED